MSDGFEVVDLLIKASANVNTSGASGATPLHYTTHRDLKEPSLSLVELLVEHGADVDSMDDNGYTALYHAARQGYNTIVKMLIACGANVNAMALDGLKPLHSAIIEGHATAATMIFERMGPDDRICLVKRTSS
jgi:ankyrin repeat protein